MATGCGRAGKRHLGDTRIARQRFASFTAVPVNHIQHPFRQQVGNQFHKQRNGQRRLFSRFQNHAVAGSQRGRQFPRGHQQREVPRDNLRHHAQRFVEMVRGGEFVDLRRRSFLRANTAGVITEMIHRQRQVGGQRFAHRFAVVPGFVNRNKFQILFQPVGNFQQRQRTRLNRGFAPGVGSGMGCIQRFFHIIFIGTGELTNHRSIYRRGVLEIGPVNRRHKLTVDKVAVLRLQGDQ